MKAWRIFNLLGCEIAMWTSSNRRLAFNIKHPRAPVPNSSYSHEKIRRRDRQCWKYKGRLSRILILALMGDTGFWHLRMGSTSALWSKTPMHLHNTTSHDWCHTKDSSDYWWKLHEFLTKQCMLTYLHNCWTLEAMRNADTQDLPGEELPATSTLGDIIILCACWDIKVTSKDHLRNLEDNYYT